MYCDSFTCGWSGILIDRRRDGGVCLGGETATVATGVAVSCGVDDFVHVDGDFLVSDIDVRCGGKCERRGNPGIWITTFGELSLADVFL